MTIDIVIPSHRREYRIAEMAQRWIDRAELSESTNVNVWIACENEDQRIYSERLHGMHPNIHTVPGNYGCYVEAVNQVAKELKGDAMILAADDVVPCQSYNVMIQHAFMQNYPNFDAVIRPNDLIHGGDEISNTHPIIGRKFYEVVGFAYYPGYFALWADPDLANIAHRSGRLVRSNTIVLEHWHHTTGKTPRDFTHEKPLSQNLSGERLFKQRTAEGFPIVKDGRLIMPEELFNG